jgi:steroid 5-alpha reductase family enzyme
VCRCCSSLTAAARRQVNTLPAPYHPPLASEDYASFILTLSSFIIEVAADSQKKAWRKAQMLKKHNQKFISKGLWAWSRHPK